ncbi:MAG TPA: glycosyltransferase family 2 protein [Vicinamibacteria bacterium]
MTVAIPCYNEAPTIAKVVADFRAQLPQAELLVVDNISSDATAREAEAAGARVVREKRRGKGYVMQTILETVETEVCVVVDGDDTYFAEDVHALLAPVLGDEADMVVGDRLQSASAAALDDLHRFGNRMILRIINSTFRTAFRDVLSGYRVMNHRFMKLVPLIFGGFETETELTLQGLEQGMVIRELPVRYRPRPSGSYSKLQPFADGYRILITVSELLRNHRPLYFFTVIAVAILAGAAAYGLAWAAGLLSPHPLAHALVVAGAILVAAGLVVVGVIVNAVKTGFREMVALDRRRH